MPHAPPARKSFVSVIQPPTSSQKEADALPRERVLLVEDHPIFRQALRHLVESTGEFEVVADCGTIAAALAQRCNPPPALAVLDLLLEDGDGVTLLRDLRRKYPSARTIILSAYRDSWNVERARRAGAVAFVEKTAAPERVLAVLRGALRGLQSFPLATREEAPAGAPAVAEDSRIFLLSAREREVAALLAAGCSNAEIANVLFIAQGTVKLHVSKIYDKLGVRSRSQAIVFLRENARCLE